MGHVTYFQDLLESISEYGKIALLRFLIENDVDSVSECGFLKNDIFRLCKEFQNILL